MIVPFTALDPRARVSDRPFKDTAKHLERAEGSDPDQIGDVPLQNVAIEQGLEARLRPANDGRGLRCLVGRRFPGWALRGEQAPGEVYGFLMIATPSKVDCEFSKLAGDHEEGIFIHPFLRL